MAKLIFLLTAAVSFAFGADPALSIRVLPTLPSPQLVGVPIGLLTQVAPVPKGIVTVRYSVSVDGGPFRVLRDYSQMRDFVWMPALYEHQARVRVNVRSSESKETAEAEIPFQILPRAKSSEVVTPTANPLIALVSAPPCPADLKFRVAFRKDSEQTEQFTPLQPCDGKHTNNVYVAGMRADTDYRVRTLLVSGDSAKAGSWMPFHTGMLDGDFPAVSVAVKREGSAAGQPVILHSAASANADVKRSFATDLDGNIVWYVNGRNFLTRVLPGGNLLVLVEGTNSVNDMRRLQILRELDIAGQTVRETNIGRVAEQLESRGIHSECKKDGKECVPGFHHEAIRLPNGHTLAIAGLERILPAGTQGATEPVDVLGDLVIDLDEEFQVTAVWNSFDHMDLKRVSLGNAKCRFGAGSGGCPPIFLAPTANGWLHSNALNYVPSTGDFIISMPEQDWVVKVDWKNGKGTGKVLWRLGEGGDFSAKTNDPNPWFSFQHDPGFLSSDPTLLTILDDGHARQRKDPSAHSRGQLWKLDEQARTATLLHNADLGVYSAAVGSAQRLKNGGYTFEAGFINPGSPYARAVETSPDGKVTHALQVEGMIVYRSFRIDDLYSGTTN